MRPLSQQYTRWSYIPGCSRRAFSISTRKKVWRLRPGIHPVSKGKFTNGAILGIHVTQYSPFGNQNEIYGSREEVGQLVNDETLVKIGKKYGKTSNQVALAWGISHGRSVIPKSKSPERITQNFDIAFELEQADVEAIDRLDRKIRFNDSSKDFGYELFTDLDGKKK